MWGGPKLTWGVFMRLEPKRGLGLTDRKWDKFGSIPGAHSAALADGSIRDTTTTGALPAWCIVSAKHKTGAAASTSSKKNTQGTKLPWLVRGQDPHPRLTGFYTFYGLGGSRCVGCLRLSEHS